MQVFLHVGSHKTGTTAIQAFAARNRDFFLKQGLYYPGLDLIGLRPQRSHLPVVSGIAGLPGANALRRGQAVDFLDRAHERARAAEADVLLSAENVFRLTAEQRVDFFQQLRRSFPGTPIRLVAALRRQDNLADSLYRNTVRREAAPDRAPPPWGRFLRNREGLFDYYSLVQTASEELETDPLLLPYADTARKETIPAFFGLLGYGVAGATPLEGRVNASFDYVDCRVKIWLHDLGADEKTFKRFDRFVGARRLRTRYSMFTHREREQFLEEHQEGNRRLCEEYPSLRASLDVSLEPDFPAEPDRDVEEEVLARLAEFRHALAARSV